MENMLYSEAVKELMSCGKFKISLGLERVEKLLNIFNNPQTELKVIHVAGTNGKGSTCAMLAKILEFSGYKTGLYTSPHLIKYTERIKINDIEISEKEFAELTNRVIETALSNNIDPTEFEILTVMAFLYFYENNADVVIMETGLGGRLDATNVVDNPLMSIITSIDFDHTDRLGETIEQIAFEKAGIIKINSPVLTLNDNNGVAVIKEIALEKVAPVFLTEYMDYKSENDLLHTHLGQVNLSLKGIWQLKNLSLVLKALEVLKENNFNIEEKSVITALGQVKWNARFQHIKDRNIIIDGAHNPSAAKLLRESLDIYFPSQKRIWVYSTLINKNYIEVIKFLMKKEDIVICTKTSSMNFAEPQDIQTNILNLIDNKMHIIAKTSMQEALDYAEELRKDTDIVIVAGSLYSAGEALSYINK
ncbi:MAG: folylpolyglutamate synthase/dihydrofolate synthase family protein [bacterium]